MTKPKIAGFGMNWQHCNRIVFAGASHSYEQTYQAIRRCWRFGQTRPVDVFVIRAETETAIIANFRRKEAAAEAMSASMVEQMQSQMGATLRRKTIPYHPSINMNVPAWIGMEETG